MNTSTILIFSFFVFANADYCKSGQLGHGFSDTIIITDDSLGINAHFYDSYSSSAVPLVISLNECNQIPRCAFEIVNAFADRFCWGKMTEIPNCPHFVEFDIQALSESTSGIKAMLNHVKKIMNESELATLDEQGLIDLDVSLAIKNRLKPPQTRIDTSRIFILGVSKGANLAMKVASKFSLISKAVIVAPIIVGDGSELIEDVKTYDGKVLIITDKRDSTSGDFAKQLTSIDTVRIESKQFIPDEKAIHMIFNRHQQSTNEESLNYLIDWLMEIERSN